MAAEIKKEIELEIAHVLFTDIVGYSKLPINQQRALVERLNEIVRGTDEFHIAETAGGLRSNTTGGRPLPGVFSIPGRPRGMARRKNIPPKQKPAAHPP